MTTGTEPVLLAGVVGSKAYGIDHAGSDTDVLGIYAAPTSLLLGLNVPGAHDVTRVTHAPDVTVHEAGKYCRLALRCNPTAVELLWLDATGYVTLSEFGHELVNIREAFLSQRYVAASYLGYATSQVTKLVGRHQSRSEEAQAKRLKHARHLWRLVYQGKSLWQTGHLPVRLTELEAHECVSWAHAAVADSNLASDLVQSIREVTREATDLPVEANEAVIEAWLQWVRHELYVPAVRLR